MQAQIEHYGGDLAALVTHLELKGCILVGHSMGCRVVLEAGDSTPAAVDALIADFIRRRPAV